MAEEKVIPYHRPDWAPALNSVYGDIIDQIGYMTAMGTVHLLGVVHDNPDISKSETSSDEVGPVKMLRSDVSGWV